MINPEYLKYANFLLRYGQIPLTYEQWMKLDSAEEEDFEIAQEWAGARK